ncbi:IS66 family transposase, partial [Streptomyces sp. PRKS01-65]|nr:IS66 family transposase [Streptomyces harenosi]
MVHMPTAEEFAALQKALAQATQTSESLAGELRITRAERDLLKEQLNKFKRQLFAAKSEASAGHQKDMFFNEAEALGSATQPAQEETEADDNTVEVPA